MRLIRLEKVLASSLGYPRIVPSHVWFLNRRSFNYPMITILHTTTKCAKTAEIDDLYLYELFGAWENFLTISSRKICLGRAPWEAESPSVADTEKPACLLSKWNWNKSKRTKKSTFNIFDTNVNCIFGVKVSVPTVSHRIFWFSLKVPSFEIVEACAIHRRACVVQLIFCVSTVSFSLLLHIFFAKNVLFLHRYY